MEVSCREIVGVLDSNGAEKKTTINMILAVLQPDSGSIHVEGMDLATCRGKVLGHKNYAAVYAPLPGNLTVQQNLRVFGLLYGVKGLSERINALIRQFDLEKFRNVECGVLSSGEQTGVALAGHAPPVGQEPSAQSLGKASVTNFWSSSTNAGCPFGQKEARLVGLGNRCESNRSNRCIW